MKFYFVPVAFLLCCSCAKTEGLNGDATLVVKLTYNSTPVVSTAAYRDSVFIHYNTMDMPDHPSTDYDALFVIEPGQDQIRIENVCRGEYAVYCTGFDAAQNRRITGGVMVFIKRNERRNEFQVNVPVD
jgi:hypothetical protein